MSINWLEHYREKANYWHKQYQEANRRANAAVVEAKKAKERQLAATRLALKYKKELDQARKYLPTFSIFKEKP